ncbi:UvrD-helicase domain-containing protein [Halorientalis brevis]|uniref:DNA 3'-5' helicase n=1 Tax=Halorientalis brevis TaxID=1126241 RepID=A0ABD6CI82_9EURY|nr:ATP-dependent DNA helicase [Halorientalis brevis]
MTDTDLTPNDRQEELIESIDGLYKVDAGAGTGKTFAVTRRYARIVEQETVTPEDVLLVTFTDNAATEMKERIVLHCQYGMRELADAPIQTFHSLCHDILQEHGHDAPTHLGIDDHITGSTQIIEDEIVEHALFREFFARFSDAHPEHEALLKIVSDETSLLGLINKLAAKGVFPTADGWYRDGERHLDGDFDAFQSLFAEVNEPQNGGSKQSRLRSKLNDYGKNKLYLPDAPPKDEIRGSGKQIPASVAERVFEEDRSALKSFVHDIYYKYLEFALSRNYLNFGFLQLFAFVLLWEDHELREDIAFEYVMIDEFQDSSEIQFKLALLLASTDNICVVGDWKQSIYSFQYAEVENIEEFDARLTRFADELNDGANRVSFPVDDVEPIRLEQNYRSTQTILDFSEEALVTSAGKYDSVDESEVDIQSLSSNSEHDNTQIEAIQHDDEHEAVLTKIQEIHENPEYKIEEDGELRLPSYGDIAVFTRTRDFGRELLHVAEQEEFPMAYEGGVELFRTDPAKLLLAWLRILEYDADRGWAVVLERAGYTLDEIKHILDAESYPDEMLAFRDQLTKLDTVGGITRQVFSKYGYTGAYADVLLNTIQSVHSSTTLTRGDLIRFIERGIETGSTHEVHTGAGTDSVTVQTIHAAKGLEYPIVILANMNSGRFPPRSGGSSPVSYQDPIGLRQRKLFAEAHGHPHIYDNWKMDVLRRCLPRDYDEERRLLYVAMTRAESHLVFSSGEDPNTFLEELPVEITEYPPQLDDVGRPATEQTQLQVAIPEPEGPQGYTPHSLMSDDVFEDVEEGRGTAFGTRVHEFAERYALGEDMTPSNPDEQNVQALLDSLSGEFRVEEEVYLPLSVGGDQVTISGVADLVHVLPDRVEIIDYKTDLGRHGESEYRKQLSVYYHVVADAYPDRDITASIFYTNEDTRREIQPLSRAELEEIV